MKTNKKANIVVLSSLLLGISCATVLFANNANPNIVTAKDVSYSLTFDKDCNKRLEPDDENYLYSFNTKTTNGNIVYLDTTYVRNNEQGIGYLEDSGIITNSFPISGLKSISVEVGQIIGSDNKLDILWGWEYFDGVGKALPDFSTKMTTSENSTVSFSFNNDYPSYFAIASENDTVEIKSISLSYSCVETEAPEIYGFIFETDETSCRVVDYRLEYNPLVTVPSEYKGLPVVGIDDEAFNNCENIISVNFPETLTYIGKSAFFGCSSLEVVFIPKNLEFIGGKSDKECNNAFANCPELVAFSIDPENKYFSCVDGGLIKNMSDPSKARLVCAYKGSLGFLNVKTIGTNAFYGLKDEDIVFYGHCEEISEYAFGDLYNTKRIFLPSSISKIDEYAVNDNTNASLKFYTDATQEEISAKEWKCSKINNNLLYGYNENFEKIR